MEVLTVKVSEDLVDGLDRIAEDHGTSRASVLRCVIDNGLQASTNQPEEYPFNPEEYELQDAVELRQQGLLDGDTGESSD
jgi:hypothetical protein